MIVATGSEDEARRSVVGRWSTGRRRATVPSNSNLEALPGGSLEEDKGRRSRTPWARDIFRSSRRRSGTSHRGGGESLSPQSFAAEGSGVVVSGSPPPPKMMIKRTFTVRNA